MKRVAAQQVKAEEEQRRRATLRAEQKALQAARKAASKALIAYISKARALRAAGEVLSARNFDVVRAGGHSDPAMLDGLHLAFAVDIIFGEWFLHAPELLGMTQRPTGEEPAK